MVALMETMIGYPHYLRARDAVSVMMAQGMQGVYEPSRYWLEELEGFDYLFDASPRLVAKLREHCYHLTGLKSYEYRRHHAHRKQPFVDKLVALRRLDKRGLWVPESPLLGGFGHEINGDLVNLDTLKFYESLIAMDKAGILSALEQSPSRPVAMEIGAGWGGFAYQMKTLLPNLTYVIVDLPPTLLFSATYLATLFPDAKMYIYSRDTAESALKNIADYDFVFLPHFITHHDMLPKLDLAINMVSFQEMTDAQIYGYVAWLWTQHCPMLYSHNRIKSPYNEQISNVEQLLDYGYALSQVSMLSVPYTVLRAPAANGSLSFNPRKSLRTLVKWALGKAHTPASGEYRHQFGRRKEALRPHAVPDSVLLAA